MLDETIAMYDATHPVQNDTIQDSIKKSSYSELMRMKKDLQDRMLETQIASLEKQIKTLGVNSPDIGFGDSKEDREYANLTKRLTVLRSVETQEKNGTLTPDSIDSQITEIENRIDLSSEQKAQKLEELKAYKEVVLAQDQLSLVNDAIKEKEANQGQEKIKKEFAEYAQETLGKMAKDKVSDEELGKLIKKFEQGVDDFTQEEAIHFLEAWSSKELEWDGGLSRKTKLDVDMTPENAEKIAKLINKLPNTGDEKKLSHWRFTPVTHLRRWGNTVAMDVVTNRIKRRNERHAKKLYREEYKLYGKVLSYDEKQKDELSKTLTPDEVAKIVEGRWFKHNVLRPTLTWAEERLHDHKVLGKALTWVEKRLLRSRAKQVKSADLTKDDMNNGWFNGYLKQKRALRQEKRSYKKATIKSMVERQEELTKKLEALNKKREELQGKSVRTKQENKELKKTMSQIQSYTELSNVLNSSLKERSKAADNKIATLKSDHQKGVAPLKQRVANRYNKISAKTSILDQSTTKGKYLYALLQKAPDDQRKILEDLANGSTQEALVDDATYKTMIKEKMQAAGIFGSIISDNKSDFIAEILKEETAHVTIKKEEKEVISQNTELDNVQEGADAPSPPPPPPPHEELGEEPPAAEAEEVIEEIVEEKEQPKKKPRIFEGEEDHAPDAGRPASTEEMFHLVESFSSMDYSEPNFDSQDNNKVSFTDKIDNHTIEIQRPDKDTYNLSGKDKDGNKIAPTVDDMRSIITTLQKEGNDSLELGEIKSPEFLANMIVAAEEMGMKIDNLDEKKKEMAEKGKGDELDKSIKAAKEQRKKENIDLAEQVNYKPEANKDDEKVDEVHRGLDALSAINGMTPEEYKKYKQSDEFKKQNISPTQEKILDGINKLQQEAKEGKIDDKNRAYLRGISKLVTDYKNIEARTTKKDRVKGRQKAFARTVSQQLNLAKGGNDTR